MIRALLLNAAIDVVGWSADRFADVAEPAASRLTDAAGWARWLATATRCVP